MDNRSLTRKNEDSKLWITNKGKRIFFRYCQKCGNERTLHIDPMGLNNGLVTCENCGDLSYASEQHLSFLSEKTPSL